MVADGFWRQANGIKSRVLESVSLTFSTTVLSCEQLSHLKIFLTVAVEHALPRNLVQALVTSAALSLCLPTDASKMHRHYQTKSLWNEILTLCTAPLDSQFRQELCKTWLITVQKINTLSQEKISCVLHQKSTVLWRFWSRKSFQLVLSTKRHMLHEFKPKRLRFWIWSADTIVNMHLCPRWCIIFTSLPNING